VQRDISIIAREYCRRARLIRTALVAARAERADFVDTAPADPRSQFADEVLSRLDGSILRYSMRLELLDIARSMKLSRFEASLIIAQVQHRSAKPSVRAASVSDRRIQISHSHKNRSQGSLKSKNRFDSADSLSLAARQSCIAVSQGGVARLFPLIVAGFVQAGIILGAWAIFS
jgi:hypothetical protein